VTVTEVPRNGVDEERFSLLFYAHAARLVRLAMLLGAADPEDVVQEAFCRVFAARGRVRGNDDQVRAYLRRAVVNEVRDRHRRRQVATSNQHLLVVPLAARDDIAPDERDEVLRAV
jgi:DNA-directed RNA polymerase specialized sigma24 family protein